MSALWTPRAMQVAPRLADSVWPTAIKRRHALLIAPFYPKDPHTSFGKHVLTPTLALTSIAAATPEEWTVTYWDENLLQGPPPYEPFPEVVGISVHLTFARRAFELAGWYRRRGAKVVLGGLHVISCPDECSAHADAIVLGEGVQLWGRILRDVEAGRLQPRYEGSYREPYRNDPPPRRDLLPEGQFLTSSSLMASRGCHNRCEFCYLATQNLHMPYQLRDVEQVVREFESGGQPYGVFIDNNLGSDPEYLRRLCRGLRPLGKIWSAAVSIDVTDNAALIREMALAGLHRRVHRFRVAAGRQPRRCPQKDPRCQPIMRGVSPCCTTMGSRVNGSFVFGFDHDRPGVFARTVEWIEENRLECATFHILTPYPGTPLFRRMKEQGRLLHTDWSLYDTGHVVFRPKHMTGGGVVRRVCLELSAAVLTSLDLAATAGGVLGGVCRTWPCPICTSDPIASGIT